MIVIHFLGTVGGEPFDIDKRMKFRIYIPTKNFSYYQNSHLFDLLNEIFSFDHFKMKDFSEEQKKIVFEKFPGLNRDQFD